MLSATHWSIGPGPYNVLMLLRKQPMGAVSENVGGPFRNTAKFAVARQISQRKVPASGKQSAVQNCVGEGA